MSQLNPALIWTMFVVACALPALIGVLVATLTARRIVARLLPPFPEYVAVQNITLRSTVETETGSQNHVLNTSAAEISSVHVALWLEKRGLVMTPKCVADMTRSKAKG